MFPEAATFHDQNPDGLGLPRAYKLLYLDPDDQGKGQTESTPVDKGHRITFGNFGKEDCGIAINGYKIDPSEVNFSVPTKVCTWQSVSVTGVPFSGYLNFEAPQPFGALTIDQQTFRVFLEEHPLSFRVKVSSNTDAVYSSGASALTWNVASDEWKNASWEDSLLFSYNTKVIEDPIEPRVVIENYFADTCM